MPVITEEGRTYQRLIADSGQPFAQKKVSIAIAQTYSIVAVQPFSCRPRCIAAVYMVHAQILSDGTGLQMLVLVFNANRIAHAVKRDDAQFIIFGSIANPAEMRGSFDAKI